jgi:hypothetical protein
MKYILFPKKDDDKFRDMILKNPYSINMRWQMNLVS